MMKSTVFFRTDAGNSSGLGHLSRCLVLAQVVRDRGGRAEFLVRGGDEEVVRMVRRQGFNCSTLPQSEDFRYEASSLEHLFPCMPNATVLDIVNSRTLADLDGLAIYLNKLHKQFGNITLIDSSGEHSLRKQMTGLFIDLLVAPYVGESLPLHPLQYRSLVGPEYFILGSKYRNILPRSVNERAERVLVTCGGSDPTGVSLKALKALDMINDRQLQIRIIVGPFFESNLKAKIASIGKISHHSITFLNAPQGLAGHIFWCDLAVATSGLTKYELAAAGTPAVLISIDKMHADVNLSFAAEGTSLDLGVHDSITVEALAEVVRQLLDDFGLRQTMAHRGQSLVDGRGADRVISEMERLSNAKN